MPADLILLVRARVANLFQDLADPFAVSVAGILLSELPESLRRFDQRRVVKMDAWETGQRRSRAEQQGLSFVLPTGVLARQVRVLVLGQVELAGPEIVIGLRLDGLLRQGRVRVIHDDVVENVEPLIDGLESKDLPDLPLLAGQKHLGDDKIGSQRAIRELRARVLADDLLVPFMGLDVVPQLKLDPPEQEQRLRVAGRIVAVQRHPPA